MSKQRRIALVTEVLNPGGIGRSMMRLGKYFLDNGFDVEVIVTKERGDWFELLEENGLKVHAVESAHHRSLQHAIRVGRHLAVGNYDVLLLNHARYAQATLGMLSDDTVVFPIIRADTEGDYMVGCANPLAWNALICISNKLHSLAQQRCPGRPVLCIPNGIEVPSDDAWQRRAPFGDSFNLIFVGRLVHDKGVGLLPRILAKSIHNGLTVTLTIVGDGPERKKLEAEFRLTKCANVVRFTGTLEPQEVYAEMLGSHAMLFPSLLEGFGYAAVESQACGCVPIASRLEGVTDMTVADRETGILVEPGNVDGFFNAVKKLSQDRDRWSRMSTAGRRRVVEKFEIGIIGNRYMKLITDTLSGAYPLPRFRRRRLPIRLGMFYWQEFVPVFVKLWWRKVCARGI